MLGGLCSDIFGSVDEMNVFFVARRARAREDHNINRVRRLCIAGVSLHSPASLEATQNVFRERGPTL